MERLEHEKSPVRPEQLPQETTAAERVLTSMESLSGFEEYTDISKMYRELPSTSLIVRRENPEALLKLLTQNTPLEIGFVGNVPYANSVGWNPHTDGSRGLDNAFLEGNGQMNGIVFVYGFEKPEGFHVATQPESKLVFAQVDRLRVRSAAGIVPPEAVRFVTVRIPIKLFPEERMTEEEKDLLWDIRNGAETTPKFIHRGFVATEKATSLSMAA